jgi:hypothetical protein
MFLFSQPTLSTSDTIQLQELKAKKMGSEWIITIIVTPFPSEGIFHLISKDNQQMYSFTEDIDFMSNSNSAKYWIKFRNLQQGHHAFMIQWSTTGERQIIFDGQIRFGEQTVEEKFHFYVPAGILMSILFLYVLFPTTRRNIEHESKTKY